MGAVWSAAENWQGLSWEKKDIAELVQASAFCGELSVQALWAWQSKTGWALRFDPARGRSDVSDNPPPKTDNSETFQFEEMGIIPWRGIGTSRKLVGRLHQPLAQGERRTAIKEHLR